MNKNERYLTAKEIAERIGMGREATRARMREMPGCVNVGNGKTQQLRVPESGLEAWLSNRVVVISAASGKLARRKNGRLQAV